MGPPGPGPGGPSKGGGSGVPLAGPGGVGEGFNTKKGKHPSKKPKAALQ